MNDKFSHLKLVNESGREIRPGQKVKNFRRETVIYRYISQAPGHGSTGKIIVEDESGEREVYPATISAEIVSRKSKEGQ